MRIPTWNTGNLTQGTVAATTVSGTLLAANANRRYLLLQNRDATGTLYLGFGTAAVAALGGVFLGPGSRFEMTMGAGNVYTGPIVGIASAGTITLNYMQGTARVLGS